MSTHLSGRFRRTLDPRLDCVVLVGSSPDATTEVLFHGVTAHDLPEQLLDPAVETTPTATGGAQQVFAVRSGERAWHVKAKGVQVHEHPAIFGREVHLPRFALRKRIAWTLLLWLARFGWGRAAIERLAARR